MIWPFRDVTTFLSSHLVQDLLNYVHLTRFSQLISSLNRLPTQAFVAWTNQIIKVSGNQFTKLSHQPIDHCSRTTRNESSQTIPGCVRRPGWPSSRGRWARIRTKWGNWRRLLLRSFVFPLNKSELFRAQIRGNLCPFSGQRSKQKQKQSTAKLDPQFRGLA